MKGYAVYFIVQVPKRNCWDVLMSEFISLLTVAHSEYFILEPIKNAGLETNWRSTLVVLSLEHSLIQLKQCLAGDLRQG